MAEVDLRKAPIIPIASDTVITETAFDQAPDVGAAVTFSRGDHTHGTPPAPPGGVPSDTVVNETVFGQAPAVGVIGTFSRGDHCHGTPPAPVIPTPSATVEDETAFDQLPDAGAADTFSRGDHTHGTPTAPVIPSASGTVEDETAFDQLPDAGIADTFSRGDHTHGTPTAPVIPTPSATVEDETAFDQLPDAGAADTFSRGDHTHGTPTAPVIPSASGTVEDETAFDQLPDAGIADTFSRGDHTHGTPTAPIIPVAADTVEDEVVFDQVPNAGAADTFSRGDHTHGTPSSAGLATLDVNSEVTPDQVRNFARYAGFVDYTTPVSGPGTITVPDKDIYFFEGGVESDRLVKYTLTGGTTGVELPALTDLTANYLVGWYNGGAPIFTIVTDVTLIDNLEYIHYCMVYRSGNNLHTEECRLTNKSLSEKMVDRFYFTHRYGHESGLYMGIQDNAGTPEFMISEGVVWIGANRITLPEMVYDSSSFFCHLDAGVWHNEYRAGNTDIINTEYQGATDLVTLTDDYYTINHIYRGVEAQLHNYILLSTDEYATEELALASPLVTNIPVLISSHAVFIGRIIIQKGAVTGTIQSAFVETFGATSGITDHNAMSGKQGGTAGEYYHLTASEYTGTGTNDFVRETSPTITTPTIASFLNANHTHAAAGATGGVVDHVNLSNKGTYTHPQIDTAIDTTLPGLVTTHAGLDTGVHGVGISTVASIADIATFAANTVEDETTYGQASAPGVADTFSRGDHTHGTPVVPALGDLSDVTIAAPVIDQILKFNGVDWVNGSPVVGAAGPGITFYLDDTKIYTDSADTYQMESLFKAPTAGPEQDEFATVNNSTRIIDQYMYNTALGVTSIDAGEWEFDTYCYVDGASGVSTIVVSVSKTEIGPGTITLTGVGTTRTATVSGATPFVPGDYNADITQTGYILTPNAVFRINGYVSDTVVTVSTKDTYTNETDVSYSINRFLFQEETDEIDNIGAPALKIVITVQPAFPINATDKLMARYFARTDNVGDIEVHFTHNGTEHYTRIHSPLIPKHNDLAGLQGGTSDQYYHLTASEYTGTGTNNFVRQTSPTITTPTIVFSPSIGVDLTAHGDIISDTVGENVVFGNILYLKSDGKWWKADATQATTMPCTAMAIATIAADAAGNLLLRGFVRNDAWNWTIGATSGLIYASTTPGAPTQTAPSLSGEQVQIIGFARTADIMFFNPSYNIVELV